MIDLYQNRQGYFLRCYFFDYVTNSENLEFSNLKKYVFYAKTESAIVKDNETLGGGYLAETSTLTISTLDKLPKIDKNTECRIYITKFKKWYSIEDVQTTIASENLDVASFTRVKEKTYLRLVELDETI